MIDLAGSVASLDALVELIAGRFGRVEPRWWAGAYLRGLLAGLERRNGWTLADVIDLYVVGRRLPAPEFDRGAGIRVVQPPGDHLAPLGVEPFVDEVADEDLGECSADVE